MRRDLKGGPQVDRDNSWDLHSIRMESLWSLKGALYLDSVGESGWMWLAQKINCFVRKNGP